MNKFLVSFPVAASMAIQMIARGDGGEGGDAGAGGGDDFSADPNFQKAVAEAVAAQTAGLKANRDSVFSQLQTTKERLAKFGDIDPDTVSGLLDRFESQEEQELFKAGKLDTIVDKRVDKMRQKFETDLGKRDEELQLSQERQHKLEQRSIAAEITKAATEAGALPSALTDFVQRSRGNFALTEKGDVIAVDTEGNQIYDTDGKTPLSAKSWALGLQAEAPHLFSKGTGGGSNGGQGQKHTAGKVGGTQAEREAHFANKFNLK